MGRYALNEYSTQFFAMVAAHMAGTNATAVARTAGKSHGWLRVHLHHKKAFGPATLSAFCKALNLPLDATLELNYLAARAHGYTVGRHYAVGTE